MSPISGPWCAQPSSERLKALLGDSLLAEEELEFLSMRDRRPFLTLIWSDV